jgi:hypothetical protein
MLVVSSPYALSSVCLIIGVVNIIHEEVSFLYEICPKLINVGISTPLLELTVY